MFLIYERFTGILLEPRLSNPVWQASTGSRAHGVPRPAHQKMVDFGLPETLASCRFVLLDVCFALPESSSGAPHVQPPLPQASGMFECFSGCLFSEYGQIVRKRLQEPLIQILPNGTLSTPPFPQCSGISSMHHPLAPGALLRHRRRRAAGPHL